MLIILLVTSLVHMVLPEKCYSCSSPLLHLRWPKDDDSNKLLYLNEFPFFSNESCDNVKNSIPVVDCPNSVCIKAVIKEPPAKRDVCIESGAVVRDCWSRVMNNAGDFAQDPKARNNRVRLTENVFEGKTIGYIYTCEGFLCNNAQFYSMFSLFFYVLACF